MTYLFEKFSHYLHRECGVVPHSRGVVAFSGGPDSLCLLHLLTLAAPSASLAFRAVHVDHGLRVTSAQDAVCAQQIAARLDVAIRVVKLDPAQYLDGNVQQSARLARYAALEQQRIEFEADWIACGHTADDQAETVLLQLVRGAGLDGLSAMRPRRGSLIRPLLATSRDQIITYLHQNSLVPVQDPSNATPRFLRNRLRQQVLPVLKEENPQVVAALCRLADLCHLENQAAEQMLNAMLPPTHTSDRGIDGVCDVRVDALLALPQALQYRAIRRLYRQHTGSTRRLSLSHVRQITAVLVESYNGQSRRSEIAYTDVPAARFGRKGNQLFVLPPARRAKCSDI